MSFKIPSLLFYIILALISLTSIAKTEVEKSKSVASTEDFSSENSKSNWGAHVGPTLTKTTIDIPNPPPKSSRTQVTVGAFYETQIYSFIHFQTEINVVQKGYDVKNSSVDFIFIEVPVYLKLKANTRYIQPFVLAGPSLIFLASSELTSTGEPVHSNQVFSNINVAFTFGAGVDFELNSRTAFVIGVRGLTPVSTNVHIHSLNQRHSVNSSSSEILTGVRFSI